MSLPKDSTRIAEEFGRAVLSQEWAKLLPLFARQTKRTQEGLEAEFGWEELGPRLRKKWAEETGEIEDIVPDLDPPERFEVFEVEDRDPPPGHDPKIPFGWVEVDFQPSEDSMFDVSYNCFLAFIDEGGPKITAYAIENAVD